MFCGNKSLGRRTFLRTLGSASAATAATAVVPVIGPKDALAYDPGKQEVRTRYRPESPDVQAFYRTNGYETLKR